MGDEQAFLRALQEKPDDLPLRLVFTEWLEERGDPRAELVRLTHTLTQSVSVANRAELEGRLRTLLGKGVRPVGPFSTNSIGMRLAWIPPGTFLMGSPATEEGSGHRDNDDEAQHKVTLTKGFYLGVCPVTQEQWQAIMGVNPSDFKGGNLPVVEVSWDDCREFLGRLSAKEGHEYRFPTEAEWEYACRAGTTTPYHFGDTISIDQVNSVYLGESRFNPDEAIYGLTPVGSFPANGWGLFDMHGNVSEWCADWYGPYLQEDTIDPRGAENGLSRVQRGGSYLYQAIGLRSAARSYDAPSHGMWDLGFRAARTFTP